MRTLATDPPSHLVSPPPPSPCVRISFDRDAAPADEVRGTLELAVMAAESLHGPVAVALDGDYHFDAEAGVARIDTGTAVGRTLALLFVGYGEREFGRRALRVERPDAARAGVSQ